MKTIEELMARLAELERRVAEAEARAARIRRAIEASAEEHGVDSRPQDGPARDKRTLH